MSMFHELMMRKKEETLYPVIKGSLTESPEGVFSGFSSSNYITMPITPSELSNCSIKLRFTTANVNTEQDIIWLKRNNENIASYFGLQTHPNGNHCYIYSYVPGSASYIATSFKLLSNTTYDCVINIENGKLSWKIGEPNNLIEQNQLKFDVSSIASFDNPICFGSLLNTGYAFNGSIDFNNSYIILNGTKYNLQAVVGYTIVGSPTITDGVVSGFSSENYLTLPSIPANSYNRIEIRTKITTGATIEAGNIIGDNSYYCNGLLIGSTGKISSQFNFSNYDRATSDVVLEANTEYTIKTIVDINAKSLMIDVNGTINTHTLQYYTDIKSIPYRFGYGYRNGTFNGSINVGVTEIYIDNKLWFNGQQA